MIIIGESGLQGSMWQWKIGLDIYILHIQWSYYHWILGS